MLAAPAARVWADPNSLVDYAIHLAKQCYPGLEVVGRQPRAYLGDGYTKYGAWVLLEGGTEMEFSMHVEQVDEVLGEIVVDDYSCYERGHGDVSCPCILPTGPQAKKESEKSAPSGQDQNKTSKDGSDRYGMTFHEE